jgi:hypothetical protein
MRSRALGAACALACSLPASTLAQGYRCYSGDGSVEVSCDDSPPASPGPGQAGDGGGQVDPAELARRAEQARLAAERLQRLQEAERRRVEAARVAYRRAQGRLAELEQLGRDTDERWRALQAALDQPRRPHLELSVLQTLRSVRLPAALGELLGPGDRAGSASLYLAQSQSLLDACTFGPTNDPSCVDARLTLENARRAAGEGRAPVGSGGAPATAPPPADAASQLAVLVDEAIALRERLLAAQQRLEAARRLPDEATRQPSIDQAGAELGALREEAVASAARAAGLGGKPARPWRTVHARGR